MGFEGFPDDEDELEEIEVSVEELEEATDALATLIKAVNPAINKQAAYDILFGAMASPEGLHAGNARAVGKLIRKSCIYGSTTTSQ